MKTYLIVLSTSALFLAACGGGETPKSTTPAEQTAPAQTFEFTINAIGNTMADMAYDTKEIKVTSGATVKINLTNAGTDETMLHNIVIVKAGSEKEVATE